LFGASNGLDYAVGTMENIKVKLDFRGSNIFALLAGVFVIGCGREEMSDATSVQVCIPPIKMPDSSLVLVTNLAYDQKYSFGLAGIHARSTLDLWYQQTARSVNEMQEDVLFTVADESGIVHLPKNYGIYLSLTTNFPSGRIGDCRFDAFPRQATNLTFYIHSVGGRKRNWVLVDSFQLPNPARGTFPIWPSETLPAVRRDGGLEFALTALQVRQGVTEYRPATVSTNDTGTKLIFRVTTNGVPTVEWQPESVQLTDSAGNLLYLWARDREVTEDGKGLFFASNLWLDPTESAWRIKAEFSHKSNYVPEELVTITNVPVKLNVSIPHGSSQATFKGVTLNIEKISGWWNGREDALLEVKMEQRPATIMQQPENFRISLVKITDDRGQEVEVAKPPRGYGVFGGSNSGIYGFVLPKESKSLNLTFAYQASRFVDFAVKPEVIPVKEHSKVSAGIQSGGIYAGPP